mmetsp:Transcript_12171/g.34230  ORF Transcript_12171/g.34230 Transcript_12171/m.34230 type:complete len:341 (+) Transcript_12171:106-1128(+)
MQSATEAGKSKDEAKKWGGGARLGGPAEDAEDEDEGAAGSGSGPSGPVKTYRLVFWAEGFTVADKEEEEEEAESDEEPAPEAPKPAARKTGMVTLSDFQQPPQGGLPPGMKMPKLPKLGALRDYESPENKEFLADLKRERVPKEMQKTDANGNRVQVSFEVADARPKTFESMQKEFAEMEKMMEAVLAKGKGKGGGGGGAAVAKPSGPPLFSGAGHTLSSSSASAPASASGAVASGASACDPALLGLVKGAAKPEVDEAKPTTTLQLRLASGARVKARLNLDHTVSDLWRLVAAEMGEAAFAAAGGHELAAGFPPKPLLDPSVTLKAADLVNAAVTHRCK